MTPHEFLQDYLGYLKGDHIDPTTLDILSALVDLNKDQSELGVLLRVENNDESPLEITITEFIQFESLLLASDSLYRLAFQLFDRRGQASINFDDFRYIVSATKQFKEYPFNFDSDFVTTHFGAKRQRQISYQEFTQILLGKWRRVTNCSSSAIVWLDFIDEQTIQTFRKLDKTSVGYISLKHFETILKELRQYQLSDFISTHLGEIVRLSSSGSVANQISFPYFTAFLQFLSNIESMRKIYLAVYEKRSRSFKSSTITKEEFLTEAQHFPRTTPLQIDVLFAVTHLLHKAEAGHGMENDSIELADFDLISAKEHLLPYRLKSEIVDEHYKVEHQSLSMKLLESAYRFALGKKDHHRWQTLIYASV